MATKITQIMDDLKTALEGIAGMQKVWKVGAFSPAILTRAASSGFPVALVKATSRSSGAQAVGPNRPTESTLSVSVAVLDGGRTAGDDEWSSDQSAELEHDVVAAVMADPARATHARDTVHRTTTYNPEIGITQVDTAVVLEFDIFHRVRFNDLTSSAP